MSDWRQGAEDWVRARPSLALAPGDALYTGNNANFEVQTGSRSFVRADENSQLSLVDQEEHRIQFKLASGRVSFDMRSMAVGDTVEVSTPSAVFVIEHPGYYRVEVKAARPISLPGAVARPRYGELRKLPPTTPGPSPQPEHGA